MSRLEHLWAGMLTDDSFFAGTDSPIGLIIHTGDHQGDALHYTSPDTDQEDQERGQANLYEVDSAFSDFVTPLVHLEDWPFGSMSTDSQEGVEQVILPLVTLPISPPV